MAQTYDVRALYEEAKKNQQTSERKIVTLSPKRLETAYGNEKEPKVEMENRD